MLLLLIPMRMSIDSCNNYHRQRWQTNSLCLYERRTSSL
jgi:hypothetical protein